MFYLIGLGLQPEHLTLEALEALKKCNAVYVDAFTSVYASGSVKFLEGLLGKKAELLNRKEVEENFSYHLDHAKKENIALCVFGAPLFATTHIQLLLDCQEKGVEWKVLEGISVQSCLPETGLDAYKFGRTITIVAPKEGYAPESFFDVLESNCRQGMHTLCLLDLELEKKKLMESCEGASLLLKIAEKRGLLEWAENLPCIAIAGLGGQKPEVVQGSLKELAKKKLKAFPQSLIVCGMLSEKESEAVQLWEAEK
ncbi:MAG: diphthine synthase [Candidatus Diapherotrites archaeon]